MANERMRLPYSLQSIPERTRLALLLIVAAIAVVYVLFRLASPRLPLEVVSPVDLIAFKADWQSRFEPYRDDFERAAAEHEIDWALLSAIGYQESKWRPDAVSRTGVKGMLMLTSVTAKEMGIADRTDPRQSIVGGARYLRHLLDKAPEHLDSNEQKWFAVAAYNAGRSRILNAYRRWTKSHGSRGWRSFERSVLDDPQDEKVLRAIQYTRRVRDFQLVALDFVGAN